MSPSPDFAHLQMAADPHDRAALRRTDDAWLAQRWADPESRVLVVSGTRIRPADGKVEWVSPADARASSSRVAAATSSCAPSAASRSSRARTRR